MSKNSQFEECSIFPLDINGSLADISDFGEDIASEAGSALGGISSHDGSKSDTDSDYNTEPSIISTISSSFNRKKNVAILYSRDSNCKAYNYHKSGWGQFLSKYFCYSVNATMFNKYISLNGYNFPELIYFVERGYISLNELIRFLEMNIISCQNIIASNDNTFCE